ncbi:MAG: CvpA family protein, partial [Desulfobacterales bacterium]
MNFFDIIVIVILGYCLIRGAFRGLVKELSSIIGVFGGFFGAYTYYPVLAKPLSKWIANVGYLNLLSFLIIFCGVFIIISILGIIINYLLKIVFLSWLDRVSGAMFGAM